MDSNVTTQKPFADPTKGAKEITQASPQSFRGIHMDFANSIGVIIRCPFFATMRDSAMGTVKTMIAGLFIGINVCIGLCKAVNMSRQCNPFGIDQYAQADLPALSPNAANHRRAVIGKCPASPSIIGALARWVGWVGMRDSFFPPHSETSRQFRCSDQAVGYWVGGLRLGLAVGLARAKQLLLSDLIRAPVVGCFFPASRLATAIPPVVRSIHSPKIVCHYTHCKSPHTVYNGTLVFDYGASLGTSVFRLDWLHSVGNLVLRGGSVAPATPYYVVRPASQ